MEEDLIANYISLDNTPITGVFFGDSFTFGVGATNNDLRFTSLVSKEFGFTEDNKGISGTTMYPSGFGNSFRERFDEIPTYSRQVLFIAYGVNDCGLRGNVSGIEKRVATSLLNGILDAKTKGFPDARIKVVSQYYVNDPLGWNKYDPVVGTDAVYNSIATSIEQVCTSENVQFFNTRQAMLDAGGDLLIADDLHPNDDGHAVIADFIAENIFY